MKIVLDSNVIIAAFAARGLCQALFEFCLENLQIILCQEILKEVEDNLFKKIKLPKKIVKQIIDYLKSNSQIVVPDKIDFRICRDKNDLMVIGSASVSDAEFIVTGDKDLLDVYHYKNIKILNPRMFWEKIRKTG